MNEDPPVSTGKGGMKTSLEGVVLLEREERLQARRSLTAAEKKLLRPFLIERDGPNCKHCSKPPEPRKQLQIHHGDGNPGNNDPANLSLVHGFCNVHLYWLHRKRGFEREKEREYTEERPPENISYEARRSLELGPTLEFELDRLLVESQGGITVREAQNRLAKICGCDQQTVGRWLDREATPEGKYSLSERTVSDGRRKRTLQFVSVRAKTEVPP